MSNRIIRNTLIALFCILSIQAAAAQQSDVFRFFQTGSVEESDDGVFITAQFENTDITVSSFESIDEKLLLKLEKYILDVLFNAVTAEDYSIEISSIEILLCRDHAVMNVTLGQYLVAVNDILAVRAGGLFQNNFIITAGSSQEEIPVTSFPCLIYDCGLFMEQDQELLLQTGFLGWAEITRQIQNWIRIGYDEYNEDVLSFVYNERVMIDADSPKKWSEVFILPPIQESVYGPGVMIEISGANFLKYYGDAGSIGFGSLTFDALFTWLRKRRPDLTNFRVFEPGCGGGLFFEYDPIVIRNENPVDVCSAGINLFGNLMFYLPGMTESRINTDVFAVGAELMLRTNFLQLLDKSDFNNDNDYLFHISPRLVLRKPIDPVIGFDLVLGAPSFRLVPGGESGFMSFLTIGLDIGLRGHYSF